ncbi:MAG: ATP-binding protein [Actinobacteria bacterium]|nr:ATP-binding protein [Actinomycetota bacterium]
MSQEIDRIASMQEDSVEGQSVSSDALDNIKSAAVEVGGSYKPMPGTEGAVGFTHFDSSSSEDNLVTVLMTRENMEELPLQALVRIKSLEDERNYFGVVVSGPFAVPDGLRTDSAIIVATTVQGKIFLPRYHGRAQVQILGEELDKQVIPPRFRPRPNSPVFTLDAEETASVLKVDGDAQLGVVVGQDDITISIPTHKKSVLPRHTGILGTTGSGKSTTVSGLVNQLQKAGVATILIDTEGEYTEIDSPTEDPTMEVALKRRGLEPDGVDNVHIYHLVGRETSRETGQTNVSSFCLKFSELSPYAVVEILELPEAQAGRFQKAYDVTRAVLRDLKIFPRSSEDEKAVLELDELDTGYPEMTISYLMDIAGIIKNQVAKQETEEQNIFNPILRTNLSRIKQRTSQVQTSHELSWLGLIGRLGRINRLKIFDNPKAKAIDCSSLLEPGRISIIDLSDTDSSQINNLVIADILRGVQRAQEKKIEQAHKARNKPTPVAIIIEEAHEFLSTQRIKQMPVLFQQVARIAKRGRKRWLGLVFVTQLPQHLPDEVLGLINNFVIHKIGDADVVSRLRRSISGIDKSQWGIVPGLAPGQALVSLTSMARPLLVSIDPTPCRLRLIE